MATTPALRAGRIRVLPSDIVAQIAAGEVIERPVSVLKELLENALDSGCTRCDVRLAADPAAFLEVTDDGCGMSMQDLPLALTRHATSKMPEAGLFAVTTLGFRGEALPSIAHVARLTIESRATGSDSAVRASARGDQVRLEEIAHAPGTTVRVEGIFDDLPPRKKFLRSPRSEVKAAVRLVTAYALARPDVAMSLEVEGRYVLRLARATSMAERVGEIFEVQAEDGFVKLEGGTPPLRLTGFLGRPERHRSSRDDQYFFVNGRWIQSGLLSQSMRQGYRSLLPPDRHPAAVIMMELPTDVVDVNFHPSKKEVRFANDGWIWNELRRAVEGSLGAALGHVAHASGPEIADAASGAASSHPGGFAPRPGQVTEWPELYRTAESLPMELREKFLAPAGSDGEEDGAAERPTGPQIGVWQLHKTYLLAPIKQGLLVVDQHAAHERVLYEQALRRLRGKLETGQTMLFPLVMDLDAEEFETLLLLMPHLERLGFSFERLSGRSVAIRSIPAGVKRWEDGMALRKLLQEGRRFASESDREGIAEKVARSYACHSAIKAGDSLGPEEMQALIDQLFATSMPHGDVHGRPTLIRLGLEDFERLFGRRRGQPLL